MENEYMAVVRALRAKEDLLTNELDRVKKARRALERIFAPETSDSSMEPARRNYTATNKSTREVVLAVMREAGEPLAVKEIVSRALQSGDWVIETTDEKVAYVRISNALMYQKKLGWVRRVEGLGWVLVHDPQENEMESPELDQPEPDHEHA